MRLFGKRKTDNYIYYYFFGIKFKKQREIYDIYDINFYKKQAEDSIKSAREVLPYINELLKPKSVLDIGCGVGTWLKVWKDYGLDIQGVDINKIDESFLYVPRDKIMISSLTDESLLEKLPKVDLVETLEVAEHLDASEAEKLMNLVTNFSDVVLFSAALPNQGGDHHVNEQYCEYWNEFFKKKDFVCFDILRNKFWDNNNICWWYRQNMLIYARGEKKELLQSLGFNPTDKPITLYHPEFVEVVFSRKK